MLLKENTSEEEWTNLIQQRVREEKIQVQKECDRLKSDGISKIVLVCRNDEPDYHGFIIPVSDLDELHVQHWSDSQIQVLPEQGLPTVCHPLPAQTDSDLQEILKFCSEEYDFWCETCQDYIRNVPEADHSHLRKLKKHLSTLF